MIMDVSLNQAPKSWGIRGSRHVDSISIFVHITMLPLFSISSRASAYCAQMVKALLMKVQKYKALERPKYIDL